MWGTERNGLSLAQSRQGQEGTGLLHTPDSWASLVLWARQAGC